MPRLPRAGSFPIRARSLRLSSLFTTFVVSPQLKALRELPWERGGSNDGLAYAASAYLKRHSAPEDRIFVSGCEPAVLWLADRLAPSRLFDIFPLLHHKPYASERAQTLLEHPPRYVCALATTPEQDPQFDLLMGQRRYEPVWDSAGGVIYRLAED